MGDAHAHPCSYWLPFCSAARIAIDFVSTRRKKCVEFTSSFFCLFETIHFKVKKYMFPLRRNSRRPTPGGKKQGNSARAHAIPTGNCLFFASRKNSSWTKKKVVFTRWLITTCFHVPQKKTTFHESSAIETLSLFLGVYNSNKSYTTRNIQL